MEIAFVYIREFFRTSFDSDSFFRIGKRSIPDSRHKHTRIFAKIAWEDSLSDKGRYCPNVSNLPKDTKTLFVLPAPYVNCDPRTKEMKK